MSTLKSVKVRNIGIRVHVLYVSYAIYLNECHTHLYACMRVSYTHLECLHVCCGCVLILTEGLLTAAVYDGLSCRLFPRLSRLCLLCSDVQTSTASRNRDSLSLSLPSVLRGHTQRHSFRRHQSSSSQLSAYAVDWLISQATQEKALIRSYRSLIHTIAPQLLAKGLWIVYAYAALAMCACAHAACKSCRVTFLVQGWLGGNLHESLKIYSMSKRISWGET